MSDFSVFASFDVEHDKSLYDLLVEQSAVAGSCFSVSSRSERFSDTETWVERVRSKIREVDHVIVICGEHTDASGGASAELRIAQEEQKPYLLLWGHRERMCTKPAGAKSTEGMYSWTLPILQDQVARLARTATKDALKREATPPRH